tara:strand:- start:40546 stop:40857 length:312 start_codon:yes stop_codon:yes gene_type:complete
MKNLVFVLMMILGAQSLFAQSYTLPQICAKYTDDGVNCQRIPFCTAQRTPAMPAGCHAKPDMSYMEAACVTISPELCNPATTGCQMYGASKAQLICTANRRYL